MDFYVYIHKKKATGEVFYVGKGKDSRAWSTKGRNRAWEYLVKKHDYIVEIVQDRLQEWYAFELEKDLIAFYGRRDCGHGTLVNLTDGGESPSGVDCPATDSTVYNFYNFNTKETFTGLRIHFKQKYSIDPCSLFHKKSNRVTINAGGWILYEDTIPTDIRIGFKGELGPTADKQIYSFINTKTGEYFKGTRVQFREKFNISTTNMFSRGVSNRGWFCVEKSNLRSRKLSAKGNRPNPNRDRITYTFENFNGETFTGLRTDFLQKFGINPAILFCKNSSLTIKGWFLQNRKEEVLLSRNNLEEFTFYNIATKEIFIGTRRKFVDTHPKVAIHHVFNQASKVIHDWTVVEIVGEDELRKSLEGRVGNNNHKSDKTVYNFVNKKTGETFTGTRHDLKNKLNCDINDLFRKSRPSKPVKGWSLVQENLQ